MSTEETTTKAQPAATKKAKASKKPAKATKAATPKKTAKATKAKSAAKPGSKAAIVLEMMKRKEGATLAEIAKATVRPGNPERITSPRQSRVFEFHG